MKYWVKIDDVEREVEVRLTGERSAIVTIEGESVDVDVVAVPGGVTLRLDGRVYDLATSSGSDAMTIAAGRHRVETQVESERSRARRRRSHHAGANAKELRAPMPGRIVKVIVGVGATVQLGDPLVVIEAMKMENELRAAGPGVVASVEVDEGASVEANTLLLTF